MSYQRGEGMQMDVDRTDGAGDITSTFEDDDDPINEPATPDEVEGTQIIDTFTPTRLSLSHYISLLIPAFSIAIYLLFWVANAEMMQGVASGTFLLSQPYDHPAFLSWYAYNFLFLSWLPIIWYCRRVLKCTVRNYLRQSWASSPSSDINGLVYMVSCSCAMQFLSLLLNMLWIFGLVNISVAMSNAIYQLQTAVTIGLSVVWLGNRFVIAEGIGIALSFTGVALIVIPPLLVDISSQDDGGDLTNGDAPNDRPIAGMCMTLLSAVVWAVYQIAWRVISKDKPEMNRLEGLMDTLATLGMMGVCNLFLGWPLLAVLDWTGLEPFVMPTWDIVPALTANSLVEYSFDLSCAIAIYLTSPVLTAITAPLTIPISLIWDHLLYGSPLQVGHFDWLGSVLVLLGVVWIEMKIPLALPCYQKTQQQRRASINGHMYDQVSSNRMFV